MLVSLVSVAVATTTTRRMVNNYALYLDIFRAFIPRLHDPANVQQTSSWPDGTPPLVQM